MKYQTKKKYEKTAERYLRWLPKDKNIFLRPDWIQFSTDAPDAIECMINWESNGVKPTQTSEPILLADYMQGKMLRDLNIHEWLIGIKEGYFFAEEFFVNGSPIENENEYESIFGCTVNKDRLKIAQYYDDLRKKIIDGNE